MISGAQIDLAAAAIANVRAGRAGAPPISNVLELLDATPRLQRLLAEVRDDAEAALEAVGFQSDPEEQGIAACMRLNAKLYKEVDELRHALEQSVKLQSHYAMLLNCWDDGQRMQFKDAEEWLARLREVKKGGQS